MAFAFFRRRQKMVLIIMAALMVAFLIGFQGVESLLRGKPGEVVLGTTADGAAITRDDLTIANYDFEILARMGLGAAVLDPNGAPAVLWPSSFLEFRSLLANGEDAPETYALLLKEASKTGIKVSDDEVDRFTARSLMGKDVLDRYSQMLRKSPKQIRRVLAGWIMVNRKFSSATNDSPPSDQEVRHMFRDLYEQIDLKVAAIPADRFIQEVPSPTDQEVASQFNDYRKVLPGTMDTVGSFGFGYLQPDRASIDYLLVREAPIAKVTEVKESDALRFYMDNKEQFQKPQEPQTQPATAASPASAPATNVSEPAIKTVQIEYPEAKPEIMKGLKAQAVLTRIDNILSRAETLVVEAKEKGVKEVYAYAKGKMTLSADNVLARKVTISIKNDPLEEAIAKLSREAGVKICYPLGDYDGGSVDSALKVSYSGEGVALGVALAAITKQAKLPELQWKMCAGIENAIFPDAGVDLFPIVVKQTAPMTMAQMNKDKILGLCITGERGQSLVGMAFMAKEFSRDERSHGVMQVGYEGPRMAVAATDEGKLLWTLASATPAHEPTELTDEIRQQVIRDLKTKIAYQMASDLGKTLQQRAIKEGMDAAAKSANLQVKQTGLYARKSISQANPQTIYMRAVLAGMPQEEAVSIALSAQPINFVWTKPKEVTLPEGEMFTSYFAERATSLAPADPNEKPEGAALVELPGAAEVLLITPIEYKPAYEATFQKERTMLAEALLSVRRHETIRSWFSLDNKNQAGVSVRVGYKRVPMPTTTQPAAPTPQE